MPIIAFTQEHGFKIDKFRQIQADTVWDIDGNYYNVMKVGNDYWLAQNLRTTRFNDGTPIPKINAAKKWSIIASPGLCDLVYKEKKPKNLLKEYLYNGYVIQNEKNVCPVGWEVADTAAYNRLIGVTNNANSHFNGAVFCDTNQFLNADSVNWTIHWYGDTIHMKSSSFSDYENDLNEFFKDHVYKVYFSYKEIGYGFYLSAFPNGRRRFDGAIKEYGDGGGSWLSKELIEYYTYYGHRQLYKGFWIEYIKISEKPKRLNFGASIKCIKSN